MTWPIKKPIALPTPLRTSASAGLCGQHLIDQCAKFAGV